MASLDYVKNTNLKQEQTIIKKIAKYQKFRFSIFSLPRGKSRTKKISLTFVEILQFVSYLNPTQAVANSVFH